jgi:DNA-binding transcriptional LysR family regulator
VSEHIEITGRYVLAVDDGNAYLEAGLAGLGVIALPTYMAAKHRAVAL